MKLPEVREQTSDEGGFALALRQADPSGAKRAAPALTFVIPCYNEAEAFPILLAQLEALSARLLAEGRISGPATALFVDDGSADATWAAISAAAAAGGREAPGLFVTGIRLSGNQGHQRALLAGLMQARGDVVVSMDADLQDDPAVVAEMIDAWRQGAEIVFGVRRRRESDSFFKRGTARLYYRVLGALGVDLIPDHADYRLMGRKSLAALAEYREVNLFLRVLIRSLGFPSAIVRYDRAPRAAGESKYPLRKMLALALDGVTSFSVAPLRLITVTGFAIAGLSFGYALYSLLDWFLGRTVPGWTSTVVPMFLLGGLHLIALGVIGEYVGKIYQETKRRPRYLIDEIVNSQPEAREEAQALPAFPSPVFTPPPFAGTVAGSVPGLQASDFRGQAAAITWPMTGTEPR